MKQILNAKLLLFLCLLILTVTLASCRFVAQTQIQPDGSGVLREAHVYAKTQGETPKETCQQATWHSQPGEATFTEEVHGAQVYCVRSRSFSNLQELKQFYAAWNGESGVQVSIKKLQLDKGQFSFDVTLDVSNSLDTDGIYEVQLTPPGRLINSNAPQKNGQKLIWAVYPGNKVT